MARQEREYRRLPGRGRKRGGFFALTPTRASLWAGREHLLYVFSTGYTEEYKRFYYRDIQAIVMRKTGRGSAWNFFSALSLFLFALLALTRTTTAAAAVFWILSGLSLLVLAGNLLRGPTCVCHLHTAVSTEELPSLSRERNARKAIDLLKPLIQRAQGMLTQEEIVARSAELFQQPEPASLSRAGAHPAENSYGGKVHEALFYLLLLDGLLSAIQIFLHSLPITVLGTLFSLAFAVIVIVALTKQHRSGLNRGLRSITWAAFIYMIVTFATSYFIGVYEVVRNPGAAGKGQWEAFKMMSHVSPADNRVLMYMLVLSAVCATTLGISGIVLLKKFQAERKAPSGVPPLSADGAASTRTGQ